VVRSPVRSNTDKTSVVSLVSVHHLRTKSELVGPVSVKGDWVGYHVYLRRGTST